MKPADIRLPPDLRQRLEVVGSLHRASDRSVWRIAARGGGEDHVLKLVHPSASQELRSAIAQEYLLLTRIRHTHWVRPHRFLCLDDGSCGYFMEFIAGAAPQGARSAGWEPRDLEGARGVLGALAMLHAMGYVHLDLKPSQILSAAGRGSILIDPGLAARVGTSIEPRGTWGFIAPEVLRGSSWDRRADLYAFGSMLAFLWMGESPLGGGEIGDQVRRQNQRPDLRLRDRMEDLPEGMDYIVESLLDPDPGKRPQSASETWRALHTIAGYRDRYLERERLPAPIDLPLFAPPEVEEGWDHAVAGSGADRWVIEGQVGTGRRRLLEWLQARAQVMGARTVLERDRLNVTTEDGRCVACRIGHGKAGEHRVRLGPVGEEAATAALEAFDLEPEGGEAAWTSQLLRLRMEERWGQEIDRRRCARARRTIAAGISGDLDPADTARLGRLLAAVDSPEVPTAEGSDSDLAARGLVRVGRDGRLEPAIPPWDMDSLRTVAGEHAVAAAHRALLSTTPPSDSLAIARHALAARDRGALMRAVTAAIDSLRARGDTVGAHDLLVDAGELLGADFVKASLTMRARLVLECGVASGLALLRRHREDLAPGWRDLIDGHMAYRGRKYEEAIAIARKVANRSGDPILRSAATTMLIRSLHQSGQHAEALDLGLPIVRSLSSSGVSDWLPIAVTLLTMLVHSGGPGDSLNELMALVEAAIPAADRRMRELAANAIGSEAFQRGDWARATHFLEMEIDAAQEVGEPASVCLAKMSLAGISFIEGRVAECEALNREALILAEQAGSTRYVASILTNLGTVLGHTGRYDEALGACRRSRVLHESAGGRELALQSRACELTVLANAGMLRAGRALFNDLVDEVPAHGPLGAGTWFDMGMIARREGKLEEAGECLRRSLDAAKECGAKDEVARSAFSLALLELASEDRMRPGDLLAIGEAEYQSSPSAEIGPLRHVAWACHHVVSGDLSGATERLALAVKLARESGQLPWLWKCHAANAMVTRRFGDPRSSADSLSAARLALSDLVSAIRNEALKESYVLLPDPRVFLAWCDLEAPPPSVLPGSSDLMPFAR